MKLHVCVLDFQPSCGKTRQVEGAIALDMLCNHVYGFLVFVGFNEKMLNTSDSSSLGGTK